MSAALYRKVPRAGPVMAAHPGSAGGGLGGRVGIGRRAFHELADEFVRVGGIAILEGGAVATHSPLM